MNDVAYILRLRQLMAAWSDRSEKEARRFADDHRDLLPRRITNAQLYGLYNIVRNAHRFDDIRHFIRHQGDKAGRAGREDVQDYWQNLEKTLSNLQAEARHLQEQAGPLPPAEGPKSALDALHCQLVEEFVQHLIAHGLYWTPEREEEGGRHSR
jgi:hypothetical protein